MKGWYTNAELAALIIPGFPSTKMGVFGWFKNRDLDARYPNKVRPRQGKGGGIERHISILPYAVKSHLNVRHLKTAEATPMEVIFNGAPNIPEPVNSETGELRRDAALLILNFWDIFLCKWSGPLETARHHFTAMYNNRKISGVPDWVFAARPHFSVNTLRCWEKKRETHQFTELAGAYGNRKGTGVLSRADGGNVETYIGALIANRPHLTSDHIRDLVRDKFGDNLDVDGQSKSLPPIRAFQRFIAKWKKDHAEALLKLTDPDAFKNKMRFSGTNMNHWVKRLNQLWEIDASPADVLLKDGRYSLYAVTDIYSRRMMVSITKTPKSDAVLMLIRRAIMAWGVPEIMRTDNGSDFISHYFKRALSALAIHQDITAPFSPEQKGTVERHIGTLQHGLMPLLPGFVGHNVADRKKIEARRSFAQRLGESDKNAFCVDLTHGELQEKTDQWLEVKYQHSPHSGLDGKKPFEMAASWTGTIRTLEDERALDILLAPIAGKNGYRVVTKFGITLDKAKFIHPDLVPGSRVFIRHDPADMGRIYVFSDDGSTFICVAECPERLGHDPGAAIRAVREGQAQRIKEEVEPLQREIRAMKPRDMIDAVLRVNAADNANLTAFPARTIEHTTKEMEAAKRATRGRKKQNQNITPEDQAIADAMFKELQGDEDGALTGDAEIITLPAAGMGERPHFDGDLDFAVWVQAHPEQATDNDRQYLEELLESPSFRLLLKENEGEASQGEKDVAAG